ncbi:MAG: hypothetical protein E7335_05970 [Clostridiales bacterium]|nr:hypothetical protein [Clostridiales bacterium]
MTVPEFLRFLALIQQNGIAEKFGGACYAITQFSAKVINIYRDFNAWCEDTGVYICKAIYELASPLYDEEKKQKLIVCYKGWGQYGWTVNIKSVRETFNVLPNSQVEADNMMMQYCTIENVSDMLRSIAEKGVKQQDLDEAFLCFQRGMYKASTLILFALIDHEFIGMGYRKKDKHGMQGRLKVGESAAKAFYDEKQQEFEEAFLFTNLWFLNIMECLVTLFADGDDFQNEPDIINRNFVSHGMSQRDVTMIDCFKVWSALYSLTVFLTHLEENSE